MNKFLDEIECKQSCLIEPVGIIDAIEGQKILDKILNALAQNCQTFLIALSAVESLDAEGKAFLLKGIESVSDAGAKVALFPSDAQKRLFLHLLE